MLQSHVLERHSPELPTYTAAEWQITTFHWLQPDNPESQWMARVMQVVEKEEAT